MLRIGSNPVKSHFYGLRTCHSFWGFYVSPRQQLGLKLDSNAIHEVRDTDITIIPPWLPFSHEILRENGWHNFMLCSLAHIPDALSWRYFKQPMRLHDKPLVHLFHDFFEYNQSQNPPNLIKSLKGQKLLAECFLNFLQELEPQQRDAIIEPNRSWLRIEPVLEHIRTHLDSNISVDELAAILDLSSDHFTKLFKRLLGQTPIQYIIHQRVARAAEYLCDSELNMDDIAQRCGFPNRRYLSRRFSEVLGIAPSVYRKNI